MQLLKDTIYQYKTNTSTDKELDKARATHDMYYFDNGSEEWVLLKPCADANCLESAFYIIGEEKQKDHTRESLMKAGISWIDFEGVLYHIYDIGKVAFSYELGSVRFETIKGLNHHLKILNYKFEEIKKYQEG